MNWLIYTFGSNIIAVSMEYIYRSKMFDNFFQALPYLIIPLLVLSYCLFYMFRFAPSYLMGWVAFAFINAILRMGTNIYMGEPLGFKIIAGIAVSIFGMALIANKI